MIGMISPRLLPFWPGSPVPEHIPQATHITHTLSPSHPPVLLVCIVV